MNPKIFEKFLNTKYGERTLYNFNRIKADLENPPEYIIPHMHSKEVSGYLEIGGGNGTYTLPIIKSLRPTKICFLEPSKIASEKFCKAMKNEKSKIAIFNKPFEKFNRREKYDIITSIHSWYYIDVKYLRKLYGLLKPNSLAFIFLDSKNDTIKKIQNLCENELYSYRSNNAEDVINWLNRHKIRYKILKYKKKFSGLIKNRVFTDKARTIISLVAWKRWDDIPYATKRNIKDILINSACISSRRLIIIHKHPKQHAKHKYLLNR